MQLKVSVLSPALILGAWLCAACAGDSERVVNVPPPEDAGVVEEKPKDASVAMRGCVDVEVEGDSVVEHLEKFTAKFKVGTAYTRTVMLFGGMPVEQPNTPSRAYIFGLDKEDAQMMAKKYPDFYLCSSVGGQEAASYIRIYDMVPATCLIHQQLVAAIRRFDANAAKGGDRTSLYLEGAPLTVTSVTDDVTGQDVSAQVSDQQFHLITAVKQLTGESLLKFGTTN